MERNNIKQMAHATVENGRKIRSAVNNKISQLSRNDLGEGIGAVESLGSSIQSIVAAHNSMRNQIEVTAIESTNYLEVTLSDDEKAAGKENLDSAVNAVVEAEASSLKSISEWNDATGKSFAGIQSNLGTIAQFNEFFKLELEGGEALS